MLGAERVGVEDNFFERGGHSLLATQVVSRVRQAFGVEPPLRDLFEAPTVAGLTARIEALRQGGASASPLPIERMPRDGSPLPVSFAQQRLWLVDRIEPGSAAYNMPYALRLRGALDAVALRASLDVLVRRHEALRTTFAEADGSPVQVIHAPGPVALPVIDLRGEPDAEPEAARLAQEEALRPFDLTRGPLLRSTLLRLGAEDHVLLFTLHHIVSDAWSRGVLVREVTELYAALLRGEEPALPELPVQYGDYALWQRGRLTEEILEEQLGFWKERLAGAPPLLEIPTDRPRAAGQSARSGYRGFALPAELSHELRALGRREGATLFMTVLAGWQALLGRWAGQDDVVVGSPVAGRTQRETEGLIGFFVNMLALRGELGGNPTWRELLARVRETALGAYEHQDLPFERVLEELVTERSLTHAPLFQAAFSLERVAVGGEPLSLGGVGLEPFEPGERVAKFDLHLAMDDADEGLSGSLVYRASLFADETAERMLRHLETLLEAMAADPAGRLSEVSLLRPAERAQVLEGWQGAPSTHPAACVHDLFAAQAARAPEAAAVSWRGARTTYAALDRASSRLAHALRRRGVGPETPVGICMSRTPELLVALLGVLRAGGAYVPLDPAYPDERLRWMIEGAGIALVLTETALANRLPEGVCHTLPLDAAETRSELATGPGAAPESGALPENLSHVVFTSGSAGRPKGVMIRHSSTVALVHWLREVVSDEERASVLFSTSINFDVSVAEVFGTLCWGGTLVLVKNALELATVREPVVYASMVPGAARELLGAGTIPESVRTLNLAGEALTPPLAQGLLGLAHVERVRNFYGPTEDTSYSTLSVVERGSEHVLIGRPMTGSQAYVLDARLRPVPPGVPGELWLAGNGLARGYAGRPDLTAESFLPNPFGTAGTRMYRTGDRVRWRASGELEYLGRMDFQVKVRGYRIEPGEIEAALLEHTGVRETAVVVREDDAGNRRLVAYWVDVEGERPGVEGLRAHVLERLPEYMVPAAYVRLEALPLTPNGKLDRKALPAPEGDAYARRGYEAPLGEVEEVLAEVWAEVLRVEGVGRWDHFFEMGGHSLLAVQVVSRLRQRLGVEVPLAEVFRLPSLAELARVVASAVRADLPPIEPVDRTAPLPLSFAQQRLWFLEQLGGLGSAYHIPARMRLRGKLDRDALRRALERIVTRHEALRTTFAQVEGEPVQRIAPVEESRFPLVEHDLSGEAEETLRRLLAAEADDVFDLERGPLIRGCLARLGEEEHVLQITLHHIVGDGWSMGVWARELSALYTAFRRGEADPLPALAVQYGDYAVWQRRWVERGVLREQAAYWKQRLAGAPELLELPTDRTRPVVQDPSGALLGVELDEGLTAGLKALSRRQGTTLFMTLLAGWAVVLSRLSGQDEVVIGTPTANRGQAEIEGLVGFFVNTLALRLDLTGSPTVGELLERVRERALEGQHHQDIPFEQVVETVQPARSLAHTPLFQVMFAWQSAPGSAATCSSTRSRCPAIRAMVPGSNRSVL
ncbi:MAG TPA: amino acid adenylation domain-containing protein [Longimicrobiaceae bacterium]